MRPQSKIVRVLELLDLGDQLVAQRGGRLGCEQRLGLPRLVDRAIGRLATVWSALACVRGNRRRRLREQVGRIEIVLAGNADQGKQRIAPGIGQRRSHPVRGRGLADRADRPVRGDPFPRGVRQQRGQPDLAGVLVDGGGLDGGDLVLAEALADDIKAAGQGGIAEGPVALARERRADGGDQGFLGVGQFALGFGQGCRNGADRFTGAVHRLPPCPRGRS